MGTCGNGPKRDGPMRVADHAQNWRCFITFYVSSPTLKRFSRQSTTVASLHRRATTGASLCLCSTTMSYSASGHHIVFELQQRSLKEKAACSHHRHTPPSTTNKSPSDESVGCGRNCLGACCLNAATAARALKSVLQGILLSSEGSKPPCLVEEKQFDRESAAISPSLSSLHYLSEPRAPLVTPSKHPLSSYPRVFCDLISDCENPQLDHSLQDSFTDPVSSFMTSTRNHQGSPMFAMFRSTNWQFSLSPPPSLILRTRSERLECAMEFLEVFRDICGEKGGKMIMDGGISTLTRVGPTRVPLPGRPHQKLDEELTRVGRRGLRLMTSTRVAVIAGVVAEAYVVVSGEDHVESRERDKLLEVFLGRAETVAEDRKFAGLVGWVLAGMGQSGMGLCGLRITRRTGVASSLSTFLVRFWSDSRDSLPLLLLFIVEPPPELLFVFVPPPASGHHIVFELQQRSLTEKAACSHHRHTPPFTTNKSPSDESVGCGRNCLGACCLNAATAVRALKSVLQGILLSSEGYEMISVIQDGLQPRLLLEKQFDRESAAISPILSSLHSLSEPRAPLVTPSKQPLSSYPRVFCNPVSDCENPQLDHSLQDSFTDPVSRAIPLLHIFENLIEFPFKIKDVCNVQKHKLTILSISSAIFDFENSIRGNYLILILVYGFN
ncbi:hypothetical protein F2Q69_00046714 [Brassica cretica]|uniref:Uncharacterized protein n=1 Tax=Brassica cretica TaxID=69181 RepID=A0A8S9PD62_BRACR|nr:hypothetical protein F2Q69_00046714 [Brassica cretica]